MASPLQGRRRGRYRPLSEINVTPMVDVMLVLLIIFMVAAPLMTSGVNVDLPKASANPLSQDSEPLTVTVNAEGKIYLQDTELPLPDLAGKLAAIADGKMDRRIFVRGDKALSYGRIMEVMATITQGGFTKVALLAEQTAAVPASGVRTPAAPAPAASTPAALAPTAPAPAAPAPAAQVPAPASRPRGRG
jgi:biopolymer transport protein TolR